jgi:hypothetical protein
MGMLERVAKELGRMPEFSGGGAGAEGGGGDDVAARLRDVCLGDDDDDEGAGDKNNSGVEGVGDGVSNGMSNVDGKNIRGEGGGARVHVNFFEIHGKKAYDLLRSRSEVHLRSDADGEVHVRGAAVGRCTFNSGDP